jgi:ParB-like chromosome segregation protein Spo0J
MEITTQIDKVEKQQQIEQQFSQYAITKLSDCRQLKINPEYENLIAKVSEKEFQKLKESIKEDGMHYAIVVNQDYEILDGHHRYRACVELGIEPRIQIIPFANKLEEKKFVIVSNLRRRQLTQKQKIDYALELENIYAELKKQKQSEAGGDRKSEEYRL